MTVTEIEQQLIQLTRAGKIQWSALGLKEHRHFSSHNSHWVVRKRTDGNFVLKHYEFFFDVPVNDLASVLEDVALDHALKSADEELTRLS